MMFEKLSNAMKGNQNARKHPLTLGATAGAGAAALGTMAGIKRHVVANKNAFSDYKIASKYKGNLAVKLKADATKRIVQSVKTGAKQGAIKSGKVALGVATGVAVSKYAHDNRKTLVKKASSIKDSASAQGFAAAKGAALLTAGAIVGGIALKDKGLLRRAVKK